MPWPDLLPLVKSELAIELDDTSNDVALLRKIAAACGHIEDRVGRVPVVTVVETVDVGLDGMAELDERPVASVANVATVDAAGAVVRDFGAGTDAAASGVLYGLPAGRVRVTYLAGRFPIPDNFLEAAVQQSAHMWRQTKSLDGQGRVRADMAMGPGMSSAMPNKVKELLGLLGKSNRSEVLVG